MFADRREIDHKILVSSAVVEPDRESFSSREY